MALLVCFREPGAKLDWSKKAIYLDQSFYELLFNYYERRESDSPLKAMVAISYDDEFIIATSEIGESLIELERIQATGGIAHPQIQLFARVLREAASRKCELAVAGDMYPDLSRK